MSIHFRCRHCGKVQAAAKSQAGTSVTCPACRGSRAVPSSRNVPADMSAPAGDAWWTKAPALKPIARVPHPFPAPPVETNAQGESRRVRLLAAAGVMAALLLLAGALAILAMPHSPKKEPDPV